MPFFPCFIYFLILSIAQESTSAPLRQLASIAGEPANAPIHKCKSGMTYAFENRRKFLTLNRRGIPNKVTDKYYDEFFDNFCLFYLGTSQISALQLLEIMDHCFKTSEISTFEKTYMSGTLITASVESQLKTGSFYLSNLDYSDRSIGVGAKNFLQVITGIIPQHVLARPIMTSITTTQEPLLSVSTKAQSFATLNFFFDPFHHEVYTKMENKYAVRDLANPSGNVECSAKQFLHECVGIVYAMQSLGIQNEKSIHLFKLCVMFIFQTIRLKRQEGADVGISVYFIPFYRGLYLELTKYLPRTSVEQALVHADTVTNVWQDGLRAFWSFENWGKKEFIDWEKNKTTKAEDILFEASKIQAIAAAHVQFLSLRTSSRTWGDYAERNCSSEAFRWYYWNSTQAGANCCSAMCDDVGRMVSESPLSKGDCCRDCNEMNCSPLSMTLSEFNIFELIPFGNQLRDFWTLMI